MSLARAAVPLPTRSLSSSRGRRCRTARGRPAVVHPTVCSAAKRSGNSVNAATGSVDPSLLGRPGTFPNVIPDRCTTDEAEWEQIAEDLNAGRKPSLPCSCLTLGVPREMYPGERRVAATPGNVMDYIKRGFNVMVEEGAGAKAGFSDEAYRSAGAAVVSTEEAFGADVGRQGPCPTGGGRRPRGGHDDPPAVRDTCRAVSPGGNHSLWQICSAS
eukprot:jgi/Tetstr1/442906/TSEL_030969.t1